MLDCRVVVLALQNDLSNRILPKKMQNWLTLIWPLRQSEICLRQELCLPSRLRELLDRGRCCHSPEDRIMINDTSPKLYHSTKLTFRLLLAQLYSLGILLVFATPLYFIFFFSVSIAPASIWTDRALPYPIHVQASSSLPYCHSYFPSFLMYGRLY